MAISVVKTYREVRNATEQHRNDDAGRNFRNNFSKEVGCDWVHIVVDFSQEHRSFVGENEDDVLDCVEGNGHGHEEEGAISVLHSLSSAVAVLEENDHEDSCDDGHNNLHVRGLRQSEDVQEVPLQQQA